MSFPVRKRKTENDFLAHAHAELCAHGIRTLLRPVDSIRGFTGYFNSETCTLAVAMRSPVWFEVFVHEYAHFHQSLEGLWTSKAELTHFGRFDEWIEGRVDLPAARVEEAVRVIQACELDAEQRATRLMTEHRLTSVNRELYTRRGNAYILMYEAARVTGAWTSRSISRSRKLIATMPTTWLRRYDRIPDDYMAAFLRDADRRRRRKNDVR